MHYPPLDGTVVGLDRKAKLGRAPSVLVSVEDEGVVGELAELGERSVHLLGGACT
jgi:hypothetical protein